MTVPPLGGTASLPPPNSTSVQLPLNPRPCLSLLRSPFHLQTLITLLTYLFTVIAIITQAVLLYRDLQWNQALEGTTSITFPTPSNGRINRYILWDDPHLKLVLRRQVTLPIIGCCLLAALLLFNLFLQVFDWKGLHLLVASLNHFLFGMGLILVAAAEICYTNHRTMKMYEKASVRLLDLVPLDMDVYPDEFPPGNPISVQLSPQYFLQIMDSCQQGSVKEWQRKSELMGIRQLQIKIPTYGELTRMGFCVGGPTLYVPVVILLIIAGLAWMNAVLCLVIRKIGMKLMSAGPTTHGLEQVKVDAVLQTGEKGDGAT